LEVVILLLLTVLNGLFSLSELALISSKRTRLEHKAQHGSHNAKIALKLLEKPNDFLSAVQVGITLIGVISGAYGGAALSAKLAPTFAALPYLSPYASQVAFVIVVAIITYLSIVIGELVPKSIALSNPEKIAIQVAPFIKLFTKIAYPIVAFLSISTKFILKMLLIKENQEQSVSEEEIKTMIKMANQQGVLEQKESEMHQNLFKFTDRRASQMMTHVSDVVGIATDTPTAEIRDIITENGYSKYPVYDGEPDNIMGVLHVTDFVQKAQKRNFNLTTSARPAVFIPENLTSIEILELFRKEKSYFGVVIDEYGSTEGIVTLHDLMEHIFGNLPDEDETDEPNIIKRDDGSYLVEGSMLIEDFVEQISIEIPDEERQEYETVAGFFIYNFKGIPHSADKFSFDGYTFEVVDMDDRRVDKVLVTKDL
jgi:putative hemolysin